MTRIGTDDWVEQVDQRTEPWRGLSSGLRRRWGGVRPSWRLAAVVAPAAMVPLVTDSSFVVRVGVNTLLFALLALGLNVVVGYAGLLDLGYVAFYGFGAYSYALLASDKLGVHLPTELAVLLVTVASGFLGYLLGLPSRRLLGDYLAIVTLFFGQIFVLLALQLGRVDLPWREQPLDLTGGPNGIVGIDPMRLFGIEFITVTHYFYLLLAIFCVAVVALHRLNESSTGRAWRAVREDPVAAELLGLPINRLKLFAFAVGGAIAGLTGTVFAAVQVGVFPQNFEVILLIMIYAAVVLGGAGSLPGVIVGAAVIAIVPEFLRVPEFSRLLFYGVLVAGLVAFLRPWWRLAGVVAATVVLGFGIKVAAERLWPADVAAAAGPPGAVVSAVQSWVVTTDVTVVGNYAFVVLIVAVLGVTTLREVARTVALPFVLYLAAFVWENRLAVEPSVTRQLIVGAILVVMMIARPHGLLGKPRVEIQ